MNNEKQQTAVEWLWRWFNDNQEATIEEGNNAFQQAKEMEKQQLMNSYWDGGIDIPNSLDCCQKYIKETYGGNK